MERIIKRGDIYYAELNPVIGSEQGGTRPVLIISNDIGNKHSPTVVVAAITSRRTNSRQPTHLRLDNIGGLPANSMILFEQLRTLDKQRLGEKITQLNDYCIEAINKPLLISIGVKNNIFRNKTRRNTDV